MKKLLTKIATTVVGKAFQILAMFIGAISYFAIFIVIWQKLDWIPKGIFEFWNQVQDPILCFICLIISLILWVLYQMIFVIIFIIPLAFIKAWIERNDNQRNDDK